MATTHTPPSEPHDSSPPSTAFDPKRFYQHQHLALSPTYNVAARTDVGIRRKSNQDAFAILPLSNGFLGVVCDGMGGYQGGDIASKLAIEAITRTFEAAHHKAQWQPQTVLHEAIQAANFAIHDASKTQETLKRMGSTIVAILVLEQQAYVAHVGDSRLYLVRDQTLLQVTRDHSAVERMKQQGQSTENAKTNIITRVLGRLPEVEIESPTLPILLQHGDRLLLCSDGLTGMLSNDEILYALTHFSDPVLAAERMIESANNLGGKDNTTLLIADYSQPQKAFAWGFSLWLLLLAALLFWPIPSSTPLRTTPTPPEIRHSSLLPPRYAVPSVLLSKPRPSPSIQRKNRKRLSIRKRRFIRKRKRKRPSIRKRKRPFIRKRRFIRKRKRPFIRKRRTSR